MNEFSLINKYLKSLSVNNPSALKLSDDIFYDSKGNAIKEKEIQYKNIDSYYVVDKITVKNKTGGETFDDYKGLGWKMPFVGSMMTLFMLSLTGLPPTAGFVGKLYIFKTLVF